MRCTLLVMAVVDRGRGAASRFLHVHWRPDPMLQSFPRWFRRAIPGNHLARHKFLQVEHVEAREMMASLVATAGMTISESGLVTWTPTNVQDHVGVSPAWAHRVPRFPRQTCWR